MENIVKFIETFVVVVFKAVVIDVLEGFVEDGNKFVY